MVRKRHYLITYVIQVNAPCECRRFRSFAFVAAAEEDRRIPAFDLERQFDCFYRN